MAAPAAPAAARRWAASAASSTSCSALPSKAPRLLSAVTGRWIEGADATGRAPPFPQVARRTAHRRPTGHGDAAGHAGGHRAFRGIHRRHLLCPHGQEAAKANPFFDGRVAHGYLIVSFAAGLFVDPIPARCWRTTASMAALPDARSTPATRSGPPDLQGDRPARRRRARRGPLGLPVTNQNGAMVAQYDVLTMVAKVWPQS